MQQQLPPAAGERAAMGQGQVGLGGSRGCSRQQQLQGWLPTRWQGQPWQLALKLGRKSSQAQCALFQAF